MVPSIERKWWEGLIKPITADVRTCAGRTFFHHRNVTGDASVLFRSSNARYVRNTTTYSLTYLLTQENPECSYGQRSICHVGGMVGPSFPWSGGRPPPCEYYVLQLCCPTLWVGDGGSLTPSAIFLEMDHCFSAPRAVGGGHSPAPLSLF